MPENYLHNHNEFSRLIRIVADEMKIDPYLVEKDYWIMQVIYGLKQQKFQFELKGGTSLSKGYNIIERFSEDIDLHIKPPEHLKVNENPNNTSPSTIKARQEFYDWLAGSINIDGIVQVVRDKIFDDTRYYRSGGIRLFYQSVTQKLEGVKEGILLEAGFDTVTPNRNRLISSWAYDRAAATAGIKIIDNRAVDIACYHPGYTFVEKLQTIATRFRQEQEEGRDIPNYMRQYYDIYCLLKSSDVLAFIGTNDYEAHKKNRFPPADYEIPVKENEAYLLNNNALRDFFRQRYIKSGSLYYKGQPDFDEVLKRIKDHLPNL